MINVDKILRDRRVGKTAGFPSRNAGILAGLQGRQADKIFSKMGDFPLALAKYPDYTNIIGRRSFGKAKFLILF